MNRDHRLINNAVAIYQQFFLLLLFDRTEVNASFSVRTHAPLFAPVVHFV